MAKQEAIPAEKVKDSRTNPAAAERTTMRDWLIAHGFKAADLKKAGSDIIVANKPRKDIVNDLRELLGKLPKKK